MSSIQVNSIKRVDGTESFTVDSDGSVTFAAGIDVSSGTIDGVVIGGNTAAAGTFTTGQFNTSLNVTGTVTADGLTVDTDTLHVDATNNRVGIGTTSPARTLHLAATNPVIRFEDTTSGNAVVNLDANFDTEGSLLIDVDPGNAGAGSHLQVKIDATERMRIDSNGDLLVGNAITTRPANASGAVSSGVQFGIGTAVSDVPIDCNANGTIAGIFNRTSNDGAVVEFKQDGLAVGSIGVFGNGALSFAGTGGTNDVGIICDGNGANIVGPWSGTAYRDNAINLGYASGRWKDLYLSGGVYLGGTTSVNYLDDYEEGTWTATLTTDGTAFTTSGNTVTGHYVKVGRQVKVNVGAFVTSPSSGTGNVIITGLPFTSSTADDTGYVSATRPGRFDLPEGSGSAITAFVGNTSTTINLVYSQNNANPVSVDASHLNGNTTPFITITLTYNVD